ncbi:hypothetical protein BLNAU_6964 [Blattamonas nauphoetae]|uniref:Uncharacterized protein n=1 Tax=Blattamonas nauphoetae TaxID=2049346 RepID=A0ABQ9Y2S0_9EUKA|nr:hypothetical protein BLNAU_6964 [Blattamonas nauphoetae]
MPFYQTLKTIMRAVWVGTPPNQPFSVCGFMIRLIFYGFACYYLIFQSIDQLQVVSYTEGLRNRYIPATCSLQGYSCESVTLPYTTSLSHGSCAHNFTVSYNPASSISTVNRGLFSFRDKARNVIEYSSNSETYNVAELTYGLCTSNSRSHTHWPSGSTTHACYYNPKKRSEVVFKLPPPTIYSSILTIGLFLLFPTALVGLTLFFFIFRLLRCCKPDLGGRIDEEPAADADNGENGAQAGANQDGEQPDGLTPAQRQMQRQGWFLPGRGAF